MLTEHALARLGQLNQRRALDPARPIPPAGTSAAATTAADGRAADSRAAEPLASPTGDDKPLDGAEVSNAGGTHWWIEKPVDSLWPDCRRHWHRHQDRRRAARGVPAEHPQLDNLAARLLDDVLLLDLETCGFAGSTVFLIGLLYQHEGCLQLVQLLARNYAEERAALHSLWQIASRKPMLVTFNGKSFDWPMVQDRTTLHRLPVGREAWALRDSSSHASGVAMRLPHASGGETKLGATAGCERPDGWELPDGWEHCDLLHHARRRWKGRLPNCRLQTLEWHVCGRRRTGDIPGRQIPEAYHNYVRTGNPVQMRSILHHNALDLVTLLQLALALT